MVDIPKPGKIKNLILSGDFTRLIVYICTGVSVALFLILALRLLEHRENGRIMSVDCNETCPHHVGHWPYVRGTRLNEIGQCPASFTKVLGPSLRGQQVGRALRSSKKTIIMDFMDARCLFKVFRIHSGKKEPIALDFTDRRRLLKAVIEDGPWPRFMRDLKEHQCAFIRSIERKLIITEYQAYIRARRLVRLFRRAYVDSDRYRK